MLLHLLDAGPSDLNVDSLAKLSDLAGSHYQLPATIGALTGLAAVILLFATPIIIVVANLRARARRVQMQNEVMIKLAEKGQPIPPELFLQPMRQRSDVGSGLSLIGIGVGLAVGFEFAGAEQAIGFALIPFFIGVARLLSWKLEKDSKNSK